MAGAAAGGDGNVVELSDRLDSLLQVPPEFQVRFNSLVPSRH